ncbi:MAG: hypothetical protein APF81_26300 [Desulfosporosinus sp. BRH_c37]|nr:MAG: hypothetical protein APF81_26300 [Desulfosporosinus sp. BRH_c37]
MDWVKLQTLYDSEKQALKTANIVATTEARLANQERGPQYEVETRVEQIDEKWQVLWRKVFIGNKTGCGGGCESCISDPLPRKNIAKVLPFKRPSV